MFNIPKDWKRESLPFPYPHPRGVNIRYCTKTYIFSTNAVARVNYRILVSEGIPYDWRDEPNEKHVDCFQHEEAIGLGLIRVHETRKNETKVTSLETMDVSFHMTMRKA